MIFSLPNSLIESALSILIESKIDDLKNSNPSISNHIDAYADMDTSPTKKFVTWLVSQHKKGNVTSNNSNVSHVIRNFDKYKNLHKIQDHSSMNYQDVEDKVLPLIGGPSTRKEIEKQQSVEGTENIFDSNNIKAFAIKTKSASQNLYGGGTERGGEVGGARGTAWCVSARSEDCLFGRYGPMYTIHNKDDDFAPYAVHPIKNMITSRFNDGDKNIDEFINKKPNLKDAIYKIKQHNENYINYLSTSPNLSKKDIDDVITNNYTYKKKLFANKNTNVIFGILSHPNLNDIDFMKNSIRHPDDNVALAALHHPNANSEVVNEAVSYGNSKVALAALHHPKSNTITRRIAAQHKDPNIALAAINHEKADVDTLNRAVTHHDPNVALAALHHPKTNIETIRKGLEHPDNNVALAALHHPKTNMDQIYLGSNYINPIVKETVLNKNLVK